MGSALKTNIQHIVGGGGGTSLLGARDAQPAPQIFNQRLDFAPLERIDGGRVGTGAGIRGRLARCGPLGHTGGELTLLKQRGRFLENLVALDHGHLELDVVIQDRRAEIAADFALLLQHHQVHRGRVKLLHPQGEQSGSHQADDGGDNDQPHPLLQHAEDIQRILRRPHGLHGHAGPLLCLQGHIVQPGLQTGRHDHAPPWGQNGPPVLPGTPFQD